MVEKEGNVRQKKRRSRILYEITILIVILMVVSGLLTFFFINSTFNRLVNKSINKLVEEQAKTISSALNYLAENETKAVLGDVQRLTPQQMAEIASGAQQGKPSPLTDLATQRLQALVKNKVLGLELTWETDAQNRIMMSTVPSQNYTKLPEEVLSGLIEAKAGGKTYIYLEKGIPSIGLKGETLVYYYNMSQVNPLLTGYAGVQFVSMHEGVASFKSFYNSEKNRATLIIGIIVVVSVLLVILITFFVLSHLIRRQITDPIDELSAAAEQVMAGDLDVKIDVRAGEEFEGLKRAFKEMVESIRKYIAKSVGEE